jgi:hypothetical protein
MKHTVAHDWRKYHGWRLVRQMIADRIAVTLIIWGARTMALGKRLSPEVWARIRTERLLP